MTAKNLSTWLGACGLLSIAAACGPVMAQAAPAAEVELGRKLFMQNGCYACHGTVGQGGERSGAPKLAPDPYPLEAFKVFVRGAKEAMPRFDPRFLSDEQLAAIHSYLASVPKGPGVGGIGVLQGFER